MNLDENVAGALSYVLWWVTGLLFYLLEKDNKFVKFHAMQSIITFLACTIVITVARWIPVFGWMLSGLFGLLAFIVWLVLIIKAYQGEKFKLPIIGDLAEQYSK